MTKIRVDDLANGSSLLSTDYGDAIVVDTFECDGCAKVVPMNPRWEVLARGMTGRECAVMWFGECHKDLGDLHTLECTHE